MIHCVMITISGVHYYRSGTDLLSIANAQLDGLGYDVISTTTSHGGPSHERRCDAVLC